MMWLRPRLLLWHGSLMGFAPDCFRALGGASPRLVSVMGLRPKFLAQTWWGVAASCFGDGASPRLKSARGSLFTQEAGLGPTAEVHHGLGEAARDRAGAQVLQIAGGSGGFVGRSGGVPGGNEEKSLGSRAAARSARASEPWPGI